MKKPKRGRPEEWTIEVSIKLAEDLIDWLNKPDNIFWQEFLVLHQKLEPNLFKHLRNKFTTRKAKVEAVLKETRNPAVKFKAVAALKKIDIFMSLIKRADTIQEYKLARKAMNAQSAAGSIFILKNKHGWADKQEVKQETRQINIDAASLTSKSLEDLLNMQEELSR